MEDYRKLTENDIYNLAQQYAPGLEPLVMSVSKLEGGHGKAGYGVNSDGVTSPMQIMSKALGGKYPVFETYAAPGKTDPRNPEHGTIAGIRLLADLYNKHYNTHGLGGIASAYFSGQPDTADSVADKNGTTVGKYKQLVEQNYQQGIRKYGELGKEGSDSWVRNQIRADIKQAQDSGTPLSLAQLRTAQAFQVPVPNATDELARQYTTAREANQAPSLEALDIIKTNQLNPDQLPSWPIPASGSGDEATVAGEVQIPSESSAGKQVKPDYTAKADLALGSANVDNAPVRAGATDAFRRFTDLQQEVANRRRGDEFMLGKDGYEMDKDKNGWFGAALRNITYNYVNDNIRKPQEDADLRRLGELAGMTAKTGKDVTDINYAGVTPAIQVATIEGKHEDKDMARTEHHVNLDLKRQQLEMQRMAMEDARKKAQAQDDATAASDAVIAKGLEVMGASNPELSAKQAKQSYSQETLTHIVNAGLSGSLGKTPFESYNNLKNSRLPISPVLEAKRNSLLEPVAASLLTSAHPDLADLRAKSGINKGTEGTAEGAKLQQQFLDRQMNMVFDTLAKGGTPPAWFRAAGIQNPYVLDSDTISRVTSSMAGKSDIKPARDLGDLVRTMSYSPNATPETIAKAIHDVVNQAFIESGNAKLGLPPPVGYFVAIPNSTAPVNIMSPSGVQQYRAYLLAKDTSEAALAARERDWLKQGDINSWEWQTQPWKVTK